jgi:hypothetical protein
MKVRGSGGNKNIFPLPHEFTVIDQNNYFPVINQIVKESK